MLHRPKTLAAARLVGFRNLVPGTVVGHDERRETTLVETWGRRLEARLRADLGPGEPVVWGVRSGAVRLDGSGSEQAIPCRIVTARDHGDETVVTLEPEGALGERLVVQLPLGTKIGGDVAAVHLPPDALNLFKDEQRL